MPKLTAKKLVDYRKYFTSVQARCPVDFQAEIGEIFGHIEAQEDRNEYLEKRVKMLIWAATHQHLVERIESNYPGASKNSWRVVGCDMGILGGDGVGWERACEWAYNSYTDSE